MSGGFEWDEAKRSVNIDKHGIDFRDAVGIFDEPHLTFPSVRGDEERQVTLGVLGTTVIALVWTDRDGTIRLISARAARRHERDIYHAACRP